MQSTYNQTQKVTEHWYGGGYDPGQKPHAEGNANPRAPGNPVTLMHAVSALEDAQIDGLERDMAVDDTCNDNLGEK